MTNYNEKQAQVICDICPIPFTLQNIDRHMQRAHLITTVRSEDESGSERSALQLLEESNDSRDDEYLQKPKLQKIDKYRKRIIKLLMKTFYSIDRVERALLVQ